jgi:glucose 1-dehydrogenase
MSVSYPEFAGKRALITGGTQGIGKAIALRLGRQGAELILTYLGDDQIPLQTQREFQDLNIKVQIFRADMGDPAALGGMLDQVHRSGPVDILVCNASHQEKKGFLQTDLALLNQTLGVNIVGNFIVLQRVARELIAAGKAGRVVICSSGHADLVFQDTFAYDVSKAALNHFMRCTALELISFNIRINAVVIGWTHTPGERRWFTEEQQTELSKSIPIGRAAQPDEIAPVLEFLLSDQAAYVAGSFYPVDGGFNLRPNSST